MCFVPNRQIPQDQPSPGMLPRAMMHQGDVVQLPPAVTEDSPNAYWDAARMGNGRGRSFYDVGGEAYPTPAQPAPMGFPEAAALVELFQSLGVGR